MLPWNITVQARNYGYSSSKVSSNPDGVIIMPLIWPIFSASISFAQLAPLSPSAECVRVEQASFG